MVTVLPTRTTWSSNTTHGSPSGPLATTRGWLSGGPTTCTVWVPAPSMVTSDEEVWYEELWASNHTAPSPVAAETSRTDPAVGTATDEMVAVGAAGGTTHAATRPTASNARATTPTPRRAATIRPFRPGSTTVCAPTSTSAGRHPTAATRSAVARPPTGGADGAAWSARTLSPRSGPSTRRSAPVPAGAAATAAWCPGRGSTRSGRRRGRPRWRRAPPRGRASGPG